MGTSALPGRRAPEGRALPFGKEKTPSGGPEGVFVECSLRRFLEREGDVGAAPEGAGNRSAPQIHEGITVSNITS